MKPTLSVNVEMLLITLGLSLFFMLFLGALPLHMPDEARYSLVSFDMFREHQALIPTIHGVAFLDKPPLFYYCQLMMLKLFGVSEFSLRLPSVFAATLSSLASFYTALVLFDRKTARLSALLLAISPLYFLMSHYANMDMLLSCFIHLSICAFLLAQQAQNQRHSYVWMISAYSFAALAFLTKGLLALAIPGMSALIWCGVYRIKPKLYLCTGIIVFLTLSLPWFILVGMKVKDFWFYFFVVQHFYRYLASHFNNQQPVWFYFAIVLASSLPWLILLKFKRAQLQNPYVGFFVINLLFVVIFFSIPTSKPLGYILPALPPLTMLIAKFLHENSARWRYLTLIGLGAILSITALSVGLWLPLYRAYALVMALVLTLTSLNSYIALNKKQWQTILASTIIALGALNLSALKLVQTLPFESTKPMAQYIKKNLNKDVPIVMLNAYYFDLLYYLPSQPILAADSWLEGLYYGDVLAEQFALGMQYFHPQSYISIDEFEQKWQQTKPLYIITNKENYENLKGQVTLLKQERGIYLLSKKKSI